MCASCRHSLLRYRNIESYLKALVSGARSRSKHKGLVFDLDAEWAIDRFRRNKGLCEATGIPLEIPKRSRTKRQKSVLIHSPSIDRINSNLGYLKVNCRIVSLSFNGMKGPYSDDDLFGLCSAFIEVYKRKRG